MDNSILLKWFEDNHIKTRTYEYFWEAFNNYLNNLSPREIEEYFGEFNPNDITIWIRSISQKCVFWDHYDSTNENQDFVEVCLNIVYKNDETFGSYYAMYDFSGEIFDDSFGSDWEIKLEYYRKQILAQVKDKFFNIATSQGMKKDVVTKIINRIK